MTQLFTQRQKCELIERFNLHCSVAQLDALIAELQRALKAQDENKEAV